MLSRIFGMILVVAFGAAAGCNQATIPEGNSQGSVTAQAEGKKFLLDKEPAGVKGVIEIRKEAKDGDEVVLVGRVGGSAKPFTEGRASFLVVDYSLKPTAECDSPWDFCELPNKEVAAARVNVKFVDGDGKTIQTGARELFGIKELSTVVVKGKVSRDDKDNVNVVATSIFIRGDK